MAQIRTVFHNNFTCIVYNYVSCEFCQNKVTTVVNFGAGATSLQKVCSVSFLCKRFISGEWVVAPQGTAQRLFWHSVYQHRCKRLKLNLIVDFFAEVGIIFLITSRAYTDLCLPKMEVRYEFLQNRINDMDVRDGQLATNRQTDIWLTFSKNYCFGLKSTPPPPWLFPAKSQNVCTMTLLSRIFFSSLCVRKWNWREKLDCFYWNQNAVNDGLNEYLLVRRVSYCYGPT